MQINIEDMTAEELFALANKKKEAELESAKQDEIKNKLVEIRNRREHLIREFEQSLAATDKEIQALQNQREQLLGKHQVALAFIDNNLAELEQSIARPNKIEPAQKSSPTTITTPSRKDKGHDKQEELAAQIMQILAGRKSISESMLKEQLRARGFSTSQLDKIMHALIREERIVDHGFGNYAAGKKAK